MIDLNGTGVVTQLPQMPLLAKDYSLFTVTPKKPAAAFPSASFEMESVFFVSQHLKLPALLVSDLNILVRGITWLV